MRIKSYFAPSVAAALAQARKELGEEAMLLSARVAPPESAAFGKYEAVFGLESAGPAAPETDSDTPRIDWLRDLLDRSPGAGLAPAPAEPPAMWVRRDSFEAGPIAFLGAPGAGKTSSLMKVAIRYGLALERPVRIVNLDSDRLGAAEPLRTFAGVLGLEATLVTDPRRIPALVQPREPRELVLIDTPGCTAANLADLRQWTLTLRQARVAEFQLVMPATVDPAIGRRQLTRFDTLGPTALLFTHTDEIESAAALTAFALDADLPLSVFGTGRRIPDDLQCPTEAPWNLAALPAARSASAA